MATLELRIQGVREAGCACGAPRSAAESLTYNPHLRSKALYGEFTRLSQRSALPQPEGNIFGVVCAYVQLLLRSNRADESRREWSSYG